MRRIVTKLMALGVTGTTLYPHIINSFKEVEKQSSSVLTVVWFLSACYTVSKTFSFTDRAFNDFIEQVGKYLAPQNLDNTNQTLIVEETIKTDRIKPKNKGVSSLKKLCTDKLSELVDDGNEQIKDQLLGFDKNVVGEELMRKDPKFFILMKNANSPIFSKRMNNILYKENKIYDKTSMDPYHPGAIVVFSPKK